MLFGTVVVAAKTVILAALLVILMTRAFVCAAKSCFFFLRICSGMVLPAGCISQRSKTMVKSCLIFS